MPEFDEETHKRKNRSNQDLRYEPGKNAGRYKSRQPGSAKKGQSEGDSSSLWVEAATSSYTAPKGKPRPKNNANGSKGRRNNRRGRGKRKLTLWEKILSFFGIKPKHKKGRRGQQKGKGGNQGNRNQQRGNNKPQGKGGNNRQRRERKQNQRNSEEGSDRPNSRKRTRKPRGERSQDDTPNTERENRRPPKGQGSKDRKPRGERKPREQQQSEKPQQEKDTRPAKIESVAAPRTEGSSIALGAIDMDPKPKTEKPVVEEKPKARRGRRRNANQRDAAVAGSKQGEFVPHPIEVSKGADSSDSKEA